MIRTSIQAEGLITNADYESDTRASSCSTVLVRMDTKTGQIDFTTHCANSNFSWRQRVNLLEWKTLPEEELEKIKTFQEAKAQFPEIKNMDIEVSCNCPHALYSGSLFNLNVLDADDTTLPRYTNAPAPEVRPPDKNDKERNHILCKHMISVIRNFLLK